MSSRFNVTELHEGINATHDKYGLVEFVGRVSLEEGYSLVVVMDENNELHLVFEDSLYDLHYYK